MKKTRLYSNIMVQSMAVLASTLYYSLAILGILLVLGEYAREMGWR